MASFRVLLFALMSLILASSCAQRREAFYFGDYSEAEAFYNKGEYERAIQKYQTYIAENPEGNLAVIAKYYVAKSHAALGQIEEARKIYQKIVEDKVDVVWTNLAEAQLKELERPQK